MNDELFTYSDEDVERALFAAAEDVFDIDRDFGDEDDSRSMDDSLTWEDYNNFDDSFWNPDELDDEGELDAKEEAAIRLGFDLWP